VSDTKELGRQIAALEAQKQLLRSAPASFGDDSKRERVHDLDAKIAALFALKREASKARYTKNDY
jgi:hypothetical protein